jgi:hypothetical protein
MKPSDFPAAAPACPKNTISCGFSLTDPKQTRNNISSTHHRMFRFKPGQIAVPDREKTMFQEET